MLDLEGQIRLLERILESDAPLDPQELQEAINVPIITAHANKVQERAVVATLECISGEVARHELALRKQLERNEELKDAIQEHNNKAEMSIPAQAVPPGLLHDELSMLSRNYLTEFSGGLSEECERVLHALVDACRSNTWVELPTSMAIVQFLISENLCKAEPVGKGLMRLQIW